MQENMNAEALTITDLCKTYNNGFVALKGINFSVQEGDFFALLGPNGAGKSTAIGIISSLVNKTSGTVKVFGADLDKTPGLVKQQLGLVPQEYNFNQFEPVVEVVINQAGFYGIPRKIAYQKAKSCLKRLDLWDRKDTESRQLSGGLKRRLMIARALVHRPRLLILDEPTAGVDIEIRRSMWSFLNEINVDGTTIILTTHYLEEAESLCRNIAIISQGEIIENTSMESLLENLDSESLVLTLEQAVEQVPVLNGFDVIRLNDKTLEVAIKSSQSLNDLFAALSKQQLCVSSLRNKENRLETLFMDMVRKTNA